MIPAWQLLAFLGGLAVLLAALAATGVLTLSLRRGQAKPKKQEAGR